MSILAIDAGTTGVTALVIDKAGQIIARGYSEFEQHFPTPGWVEHDPEQIWQATLQAVKESDAINHGISCIGITNQRETAVIWDRQTLVSPTRAIVWQDRRTSIFTEELTEKNKGDWIRKKTGLNIDPYFTASKFLWWKRNKPEIWSGVENGKYALGTIDSYLVARLSGGRHHITDASNASRTQLMDLVTCQWDSDLLAAFEIPRIALPEIVSCWGNLAKTDPDSFLGIAAPITGMAGDQQAALFGQTGFDEGSSKCTYGTGAFILTNTKDKIVISDRGLLATVAWKSPDGEVTYASEGSVFVAGAAVQWLRDQLGIIESSAQVEELATTAGSSDGVVFVPALTGLGAPFWNSEIRGSLLGITRGTSKANIAYATLEAIAYQVGAVVKAMSEDSGKKVALLRVDGGAAANSLMLQIQADQLQAVVVRAKNLESTGLGAGLLAGLGSGIWSSLDQLRQLNPAAEEFAPKQDRSDSYQRWLEAVQATSKF
ncbi:MAG: glycerol kinase GlpK [Actinobacteria bacterium]|uniref:ATP:glycerol 3-phosphotransferase n=1 Tax=freshwater metagenome TaxID=449393 RepID=A0A6J6DFE6_9ZZZZ|nr:glycerol kinase GlpK [Actinomycetota bacterium]MTA89886.1 glycerol kinase GlpK [Actinomycetota bacterium]